MENNPTPLDRLQHWVKESIMLKLVSIGLLSLILLIPASWVMSLMDERQSRATEVIAEISSKWSGPQTLAGPLLRVPYTRVVKNKRWEDGKPIEEVFESTEFAYFLPDELVISGDLSPHVRHRGIFDAIVYDSRISVRAKFPDLDFARWNIEDGRVHWAKAELLTGISDLRGISENPVIRLSSVNLSSEPINDIGVNVNNVHDGSNESGIVTKLPWTQRPDSALSVTLDLQLKGSERLYVVPAGKTTDVTLAGSWSSPSFEGALLPVQAPDITAERFSAEWKVLSFNRPFAQQWINEEQNLVGSSFGVRLDLPADQYQKSIRTAKYGILIIILAFTALFLVEITSRVRIHPFQYILVGVALIIYYSLLLSISEHLGYNAAYAISSVATVILVALYASTFLPGKSMVGLFTGLMVAFYGFIFVIVQAQDYSLLIGSMGLFAIIAVIMYFSRRIAWYK